MSQLSEKAIEEHLRDAATRHGILAYKFTSPGNSGVPDRLLVGRHLVTGETVTAFAEVKRPGGRTRPLQDAQIERLRAVGAIVDVLDSFEAVDAWLERVYGVGAPDARPATPAPPATGGGHVAGFTLQAKSPL